MPPTVNNEMKAGKQLEKIGIRTRNAPLFAIF